MTENKYRVKIDLKRRFSSEIPTFVQYDDARLEFVLLDAGVVVDLTGVTRVEFAHKRPDGVTIVGDGGVAGDTIYYDYEGSEMAVTGTVMTSFSIFDEDGTKVSVQPFIVQIVTDLRDDVVNPADPQYGALQTLIAEVEVATTNANDAATYATEAGDYANEMGDDALQVATDNKTRYLPSVTTVALRNSTYTTPQHGDTVRVTEDTPYPSTYRYVSGTGWTKVDENNPTAVNQALSQLEESARQTTTLSSGVSVVSGGVDAIADVEIEGRTLTSLGNSNLEATKQYVVADSKTKVVVNDGVTYGGVTQSGVAKFTKGTTTVSTANFVGKVSGSTVANPHKMGNKPNATSLTVPSAFNDEGNQGRLNNIATLNGVPDTQLSSTNGAIAQSLFSFDIIAEIERKLGVIPKSTLAEKVQWVKDNVESLTANWHGFGSSVGGNKSSFDWWNGTSWVSSATRQHTSSTVGKISVTINPLSSFPTSIQSDGFAHFLAYAEPSDGVTNSSISTDYIDLVVTLKATAQLNTRPTIIRVENFEGKVSGSVVENAHMSKYRQNGTILANPITDAWTEFNSTAIGNVQKLDATVYPISSTINTAIAQQLFSFNLIEAVERNIGKIPRSTVADKVQWLKDNVTKLTGNWHGFGSSVGGNKATLSAWIGSWATQSSNTQSVVFKNSANIAETNSVTKISNSIQSDGFLHFLAYADPSDGTTASTINTDYIDLEIELKPTADFTKPKVALYEVASDSYAKILVDWNADEVKKRFPIVEGTQHLQGVGVIAEGENLLPPFTEWTLHANAKGVSPYELELNATGSNQQNKTTVNALANQSYTFTFGSFTTNSKMWVTAKDINGVTISSPVSYVNIPASVTFTTPSNTKSIEIGFDNAGITGTFKFTNPMLTLGNVAKPFVPRNPSYLYADVKLGAIGTARDVLYEQDGSRFVRKVVEKDVIVDGSLGWLFSADYAGFKQFYIPLPTGIATYATSAIPELLLDYSGLKYKHYSSDASGTGGDATTITGGNTYLLVRDIKTGFGESYVPSVAEIKAYFYGWKMNNGTYGTNYEATGTKTWIPIGDTTNARAVTVVPTSASPTQVDGTIQPYKLSYVLATPQVVNVTDKVEGSLKVNGATQVEVFSGVVRREKANFVLFNGEYLINNIALSTSLLKNKVFDFISFYKNGVKDTKVVKVVHPNGYGKVFAKMATSDFDPTAEYTVTYIALDKHLLTANPTNVKLLYANNIRSALEDVVGEVSDNSTQLSVHEKAIVDLYVRVKALGG